MSTAVAEPIVDAAAHRVATFLSWHRQQDFEPTEIERAVNVPVLTMRNALFEQRLAELGVDVHRDDRGSCYLRMPSRAERRHTNRIAVRHAAEGGAPVEPVATAEAGRELRAKRRPVCGAEKRRRRRRRELARM